MKVITRIEWNENETARKISLFFRLEKKHDAFFRHLRWYFHFLRLSFRINLKKLTVHMATRPRMRTIIA